MTDSMKNLEDGLASYNDDWLVSDRKPYRYLLRLSSALSGFVMAVGLV